MRALVWHGPREMSVDDVPDPAPAAFAELAAGPSERLKVFLA